MNALLLQLYAIATFDVGAKIENTAAKANIIANVQKTLYIRMDSSYLKEFWKSISMSKSARCLQGEINRNALREIHPSISLGCFIKKPVEIDYLIGRVLQELD